MKLLLALLSLTAVICRGSKAILCTLQSAALIESSVENDGGNDRQGRTNICSNKKNILERSLHDITDSGDNILTICARSQMKAPDVKAAPMKSVFTKLDKDNKRWVLGILIFSFQRL